MSETRFNIGELAQRAGLSVRTLRHYDTLGLLTATERTEAAYRRYSPNDLTRLLQIRSLKTLGLSLEEIGRALDDPACDVKTVLAQHLAAARLRLQRDQALVTQLQRLQTRSETGWAELAEVIELMQTLADPQGDKNARIRSAFSLGAAARQEALPVLVEQLITEPDFFVRETLTWAVVRMGAAALPALLPLLEYADPAVRLQVVHTLSKLSEPRATAALLLAVQDPDAEVARRAVFALGQLGSSEALGGLIAALGQPSAEQRQSLTTALVQVGSAAVPALIEALDQPSALVRAQAADILGLIGSGEAVPALADLLGDGDWEVRFAALSALG